MTKQSKHYLDSANRMLHQLGCIMEGRISDSRSRFITYILYPTNELTTTIATKTLATTDPVPVRWAIKRARAYSRGDLASF